MATRRKLTPEDVVGLKMASDAQITPDGRLVAFVVGDQYTSGTKLPRSSIWTVPTTGGEPIQITHGPLADTRPRWSPDGQTLAFLSDRAEDGQRQVYLLPVKGGDAVQLTEIEGNIPTDRGLNPLRWSPDGRRIAVMKTEADTEDEKRRKADGYDELAFERNPKLTRLYLVDVATREVSCVSPEGLQVWEFCWAPSGQEMAVVTSDLPLESSWYGCRLAKFSIGEGPAQTLHNTERQVSSPVWSPDGHSIAFVSSTWSDRGSVGGGIFLAPADGGEARELSANHVASASWLEWTGDGSRLVTAAHEQGSVGLAEVDVATGERRSLWRAEAALSETSWQQFSRDAEGNIAVVLEDDSNPRDVWVTDHTAAQSTWRRLTSFNPQASEYALSPVETIHWKGADGWEMQGLLVRPPLTSTADRLPLVTLVHGGPTSLHAHRYLGSSSWPQLLAANGMAVFLPNPRGSTGWGLDFAESNINDMGGKDWEDIRLGIDHCVDLGVADRDRLGIGGWSYGGFIAAWAVTQVDIFKAAMMGAGISDWRSFHGKSFLSGKEGWDSIYYGDADPWDPDGIFTKFSPINHIKRVKTPTLILHGEEDEDVPVEQSYLFHRALSDLGVEVELVTYPREAHGLKEVSHVLDLNRRIIGWFRKHLDA